MMSRVHAGQLGQIGLSGVGKRRLGELLEEAVRFAVDDAVPLLDGGASDGLCEMALAGPGRSEEESVFALGDEAGGGELEDERAVDLLVEGEVEAVERAVGISEAGLLVAPGEQPVLAALEFVGDERGDQVERGHLLDLSLLQTRVEDVGHSGEAEFAERLVEFDEIHDGSPVLRSMRSR